MRTDNVKCLNPWDPQSKRQYMIDGVYATLNAGQAIGGQAHGICYAVEGNVVDRESSKNGKGWCEDVSPTLNTQDRHAVCFRKTSHPRNSEEGQGYETTSVADTLNVFDNCEGRTPIIVVSESEVIALEGNGARPSHMGNGYSDCGTMYTLNTIEQHSVCFLMDAMNSNSMKSPNPNSGFHATEISKCLDTKCLEPSCNQGGMMICESVDCITKQLSTESDIAPTLEATDYKEPHLVCYEGQNCCTDTETAFTVQAGRADDHHIPGICYAVENHPNDSRVTVSADGIVQSLTSRMGTGGNNTPIALIVNDKGE